jgi:hypothetical protein
MIIQLYQNCPSILHGSLVYLDLPFVNNFRRSLVQIPTPAVFLHITGTGCGIRGFVKSRYHTRTRGTRTRNTAGIPIPVSHTNCKTAEDRAA